MEVNIERLSGKFHLKASNEENLFVETDGSEAIGGTNKGVRPMQMILMALGTCSAIDVIMILEKQKQDLQDIKIKINGTRAVDQIPSVFTHIDIDFRLFGPIDEKKASRAVELSLEKYCSVAQMLKKSATINYSFEVLEAEQ